MLRTDPIGVALLLEAVDELVVVERPVAANRPDAGGFGQFLQGPLVKGPEIVVEAFALRLQPLVHHQAQAADKGELGLEARLVLLAE